MSRNPVLVVDDEPDVRGLLKAVLDFYAIPTVVATDGEEAVELARQTQPSLVLLDLLLPGLGGFEVVKRLKADPATRDIPVIALTVLDKREGLSRALRAGCDDFLAKPFDLKVLHEKLATYLTLDEAKKESG
ncbi:MAG: response regulator [Chloroflexota bacterium]